MRYWLLIVSILLIKLLSSSDSTAVNSFPINFDKNASYLIIVVDRLGLANRLRIMASAFSLSRKAVRKLVVLVNQFWIHDIYDCPNYNLFCLYYQSGLLLKSVGRILVIYLKMILMELLFLTLSLHLIVPSLMLYNLSLNSKVLEYPLCTRKISW